jgi:hypothetical protein
MSDSQPSDKGEIMFFFDLLFALIIALVLTGLFAAGFRGHKTVSVLVGFFVLVLLVTWAGGLWLNPIGYPLYGVNWIAFIVVGLIVALLITALLPPARPPRTRREAEQQARVEAETLAIFDLFFWILILGLILAIIAAYL